MVARRMATTIIALAATLGMTLSMALGLASAAYAFDEAKYPDLSGQWHRVGPDRFDGGTNRDAPLTPEYRGIYEKVRKNAAGNMIADPMLSCQAPGMPRVMMAYAPIEFIVTPGTTHILIENIHDSRRIHTDGRPWPGEVDPSFRGLSIGQWQDTDGDGRFDTLIAETRHFQGPRHFDGSGLPLHQDNNTVIRERIFLDKSSSDILVDEITVTDGALTRPWTVTKTYRRDRTPIAMHRESVCADNSTHVAIGEEMYVVGPDGNLAPTRPGQPAPDLRYFPR
jgi:hypothetical protein